MITEIKADLFDQINHSFAHCVSKDLRMGAGIAKKFREIYGRVDELRNQNKEIGEIAELKDRDTYIFYMVTKERFHCKPTYEDLRNCLNNLKLRCNTLNITKLAIPRIGCGLDRLNWMIVRQMLNEIFEDGGIHILVCVV